MSLIVNGFNTSLEYRRCVRCIQDTTVPGIIFNDEGVCQHCIIHDELEKIYPNDSRGEAKIHEIISRVRKRNKKRKYDVVLGLSGGRDSSFLLHLCSSVWNLRVLAVHFNDGFDNPTAGENMLKMCEKLNVDLRTITSNWKQSRDLKIMELKASTPQLNTGTDVGIGASLYGVAHKEGIKDIFFAQSFRTEGLKPLSWAYFEGDYLRSIHKVHGEEPLNKWTPSKPSYNLGYKELSYYVYISKIKTHAPLYYYPYIRKKAESILSEKYDWVYPGAHYYDDLYWSLITYVHRIKFNIDLRLNCYSALIRDSQMQRDEALELVKDVYKIEDEDIIRLCLKRLNISKEDFESFIKLKPKHFTDYKCNYHLLNSFKYLILALCKMNYFPMSVYYKWFTIGTGIESIKKSSLDINSL